MEKRCKEEMGLNPINSSPPQNLDAENLRGYERNNVILE